MVVGLRLCADELVRPFPGTMYPPRGSRAVAGYGSMLLMGPVTVLVSNVSCGWRRYRLNLT